MGKIVSTILLILISFSFLGFAYSADENQDELATELTTEFNFFTGMFDFSDDKQASPVLGLQHQNEELFIDTGKGRMSPITGGFITSKNAFYLYTGVQAEYEIGSFNFTPSFAPGYYGKGNGKDLGSVVEFKTEVQVTYDLSEGSHLGMSYNHISNASIGAKNPGANSYMFNFLKQF